MRPMRWLWSRRIPIGVPSLVVGEEGMGKGTLAAWMIARATCGELDGDFKDEPIRVLVIGDEDAFEPIWVPRLYAAGADLAMVRTLDDGEYLDDLTKRASDLAATVKQEGIRLVLLDALLDHIPGGDGGAGIYNPKSVREALLPLRRIAGEQEIAAVGLMHPIKGNVSAFRQLLAGSHQFNAISRSSLLLGEDPDDDHGRVLVRGKGNHSAAPASFEFKIAAQIVELNDHTFEVPRVVGGHEGDRTMRDLLAGGPKAPVREGLADELEALLTNEGQGQAVLARAVGRDRTDGSVRRALNQLAEEGRAMKNAKGWCKPPRRASATPKGDGTARATPETPAPDRHVDQMDDDPLQALIDSSESER
ncbi:MAG: AAA family ATPase [Solirubrobacteraceae bacterium]